MQILISIAREDRNEMKIKKGMRILSSMLLMGALAAPLAVQAQDRDDKHDRDDQAKNQRVYDSNHKDYHTWNDDEDRNYRQWYTQKYKGREYREYNRLNKKDQAAYWNWRHQHGDNDRDDHHDKDHDKDHR